MSGYTLELPSAARLVFDAGMSVKLVINPRPAACTFVFYPEGAGYICKTCGKWGSHADHFSEAEHSGGVMGIPANRVLDESGDWAGSWFAFWEEDCRSPPIYIVRAESFEAAYEDFCGTLPNAEPDMDEDQRTQWEHSGMDHYTYSDAAGHVVFTENVNGREIRLIEVTL